MGGSTGRLKSSKIVEIAVRTSIKTNLFVAESSKDCQFELPPKSRSAKLW